MTMLIMMYVTFDVNGDIKSIGPDIPAESDIYTSVTFPLTEVEAFITGKKNPFDYYIKITKRAVRTEYKITRKQALMVNTIRTLDNYLTEIPKIPKSSDALILIENIVNERKIKISAGAVLKTLCDDPESDEEIELVDTFRSHPPVALFFTARKDPYYLLHTTILSPGSLLSTGEVYTEYKMDLSNTSCYTRKLIDGYSYIIRK